MKSGTITAHDFYRRAAVFLTGGFGAICIGSQLTHVQANWLLRGGGSLVWACVAIGFPAVWEDRGKRAFRDSAMVIPLAVLTYALIPLLIVIAARAGMPLRDGALAHLDSLVGVDVPAIAHWATSHAAGRFLNYTYPLLTPFLLAAAFLPANTGKVQAAREFLLANLYACTFALPLFALMPAVGPWVQHSTGTPAQVDTEQALLSIRQASTFHFASPQNVGVVACPSYHVIWAILCCSTLSCYRIARWPLRILAGCIILSTLTTGWHYFSDVLAGIAIAMLSLRLATQLTNTKAPPPPELDGETVKVKLCAPTEPLESVTLTVNV